MFEACGGPHCLLVSERKLVSQVWFPKIPEMLRKELFFGKTIFCAIPLCLLFFLMKPPTFSP